MRRNCAPSLITAPKHRSGSHCGNSSRDRVTSRFSPWWARPTTSPKMISSQGSRFREGLTRSPITVLVFDTRGGRECRQQQERRQKDEQGKLEAAEPIGQLADREGGV